MDRTNTMDKYKIYCLNKNYRDICLIDGQNINISLPLKDYGSFDYGTIKDLYALFGTSVPSLQQKKDTRNTIHIFYSIERKKVMDHIYVINYLLFIIFRCCNCGEFTQDLLSFLLFFDIFMMICCLGIEMSLFMQWLQYCRY